MIWASSSRTSATCCWSSAGRTLLESAMLVKASDSVASMIAPAKARPKERPKRSGRRRHPGGLADPLLRDRRKRVVVELGGQEAETGSRDRQGEQQRKAGVRRRDERDQDHHRCHEQHEAREHDACRSPLARFLPGEHRDTEHGEREGGERQARFERVVAPDELEVDRQRDQHPAQRDLLKKYLGDPEAVRLGCEQRRIEQRSLALALAPTEPVHEGRHRRDPDREQHPDGFAARLPDEHT